MMDVWSDDEDRKPYDDDEINDDLFGGSKVPMVTVVALGVVICVAFWYGVWCLVRAVLAD